MCPFLSVHHVMCGYLPQVYTSPPLQYTILLEKENATVSQQFYTPRVNTSAAGDVPNARPPPISTSFLFSTPVLVKASFSLSLVGSHACMMIKQTTKNNNQALCHVSRCCRKNFVRRRQLPRTRLFLSLPLVVYWDLPALTYSHLHMCAPVICITPEKTPEGKIPR